MASHAVRVLILVLCVIFVCIIFGGAFDYAAGQELGKTHPLSSGANSSTSNSKIRGGDRMYRRDPPPSNWNQRGRTVPPGQSAAQLRFRAYRQKMALRARIAKSGAPGSQSGSTVWVPLGPAPLASDATGDGGQNYNWVSGRATSVVI